MCPKVKLQTCVFHVFSIRLLIIGYKSLSGIRCTKPGVFFPTRGRLFLISLESAALANNGRLLGVCEGQEIKPSGLLSIIPTLSSSCKSIKYEREKYTWCKVGRSDGRCGIPCLPQQVCPQMFQTDSRSKTPASH